MISLTLPGKSFFSSPKPPPTIPDTAKEDAKNAAAKKVRQSEASRKGRAATIIAAPEDQLGTATVSRPSAGKLG